MVKRFLVALLIILGAGTFAHAEVPALKGRVNDYASVLSSGQIDKLTKQIESYEKRPDHPQIAILLINTLGDEQAIEPYANEVFHEWKLGSKEHDNGVLIVVVVKQRKMRIEVGYGMEGAIPDQVASQIIDLMRPSFKAGDYAKGLETAITEIVKKADPASVTENKGGDNATLIFWIILGAIILLVLCCILFGPEIVFDLIFNLLGAIVGASLGASFGGGGGDSGGGGSSGDW